jgi:C-terminal processing protease CtpA/Prc
MTIRTAAFAALLLLLPFAGSAGLALPALDRNVAPVEVMNEIGAIVRREFFDPQALGDFDEAEKRFTALAAAGRLDEASNGWLETLKATHTGRFTPDEIEYYELAEIFQRTIRNRRGLFPPDGVVSYPGIGMVPQTIGGKLFVADVYDGGPAARSGVKVGDEIVSVGGEPYAPIAAFEGKVGQLVELKVRRAAGAQPFTIPVPVERLRPRDVFLDAIRSSAHIIEKEGRRIGYLRLWAFAFSGVEDLVMELLVSEPLKDADGLVLDLRGRWGGAPASAADLFIGRSPHVKLIDRDGDEHVAHARWDRPVVGIIDEGSRSGMEILAHGLKQAGVPLVGTRTAGAVVAARVFRLRDNSLLELAVLDVHVDGARLEGNGVMANVEMAFDIRYAAGADPQLERAVAGISAILDGDCILSRGGENFAQRTDPLPAPNASANHRIACSWKEK